MKYYNWKNSTFELLCVDGEIGKYNGFMGFHINMDSVEYFKSKGYYVAYAQYNKDDSMWWLASHTADMKQCFMICKENESTLYNCNNISK
jgi:hypothetical protein